MAVPFGKSPVAKSTSPRVLNTKVDYNLNDIQAWQNALHIASDIIPPGWYTRTQLCEMFNVSESTIKRNIDRLEKTNLIEKKMFKIKIKDKKRFPIPHYKLCSQKT